MKWLLLLALLSPAFAHEHAVTESPEQARVIEFLRTWKRPVNRWASCCYVDGARQDCFAVKETRIVDGAFEVFPEVEGHPEYARWYRVPHNVEEANQPDGRESPDGRSYVCILGERVICFVAGAGT